MSLKYWQRCAVWTLLLLCGLSASAAGVCLRVSAPTGLDASAGAYVDVPVQLGPLEGADNILGYIVSLQFDTGALDFVELRDCIGGVTYGASDWERSHILLGNELRVVASGATPLTGQGCLFTARFRLSPAALPASCSTVHFGAASAFGDGSLCLDLLDGTVCAACR